MRKIILAASAGAFGLLVAAAPASALSSYTVNTDGGNGFASDNISPPPRQPVTMMAPAGSNYGADAAAINQFNYSNQQQEPSRDMSWQNTGYYLRSDR